MKKLLVILLLLQASYTAFAQTDSLKKAKYKFGVSVGFLFNNSLINSISGRNVNLLFERDNQHLYTNALLIDIFVPYLGFSYYQSSKIEHTVSICDVPKFQIENDEISDGGGTADVKKYSINYECIYRVFSKKSISPQLGLAINYSHTNIADNLDYLASGKPQSANYAITDKSHLFIMNIPFGLSFGKDRIQFAIHSTLNLMGYASGNQKQVYSYSDGLFTPPRQGTITTSQNYFKILNMNDFHKSHLLFLSSINFKLVYNFNIKT